jgi:hypothetical protein
MFTRNQTVEIYKDGILQGRGNVITVSNGKVLVGGRWYDNHTGTGIGFSYSHYVISELDNEND